MSNFFGFLINFYTLPVFKIKPYNTDSLKISNWSVT
jgi:hypothetical protein